MPSSGSECCLGIDPSFLASLIFFFFLKNKIGRLNSHQSSLTGYTLFSGGSFEFRGMTT